MDTIKQIEDALESVTFYLKSALTDYTASQLELNKEMKKSKVLLEHFHNAHGHPCCHSYDGTTDYKKYDSPFFKNVEQPCMELKFYPKVEESLTPVELLLKEVSSEQDWDNNGLIFLKHFLLNPLDKDVPKVICAMERPYLKNLFIPKYSRNDYLSTVSKYLY